MRQLDGGAATRRTEFVRKKVSEVLKGRHPKK